MAPSTDTACAAVPRPPRLRLPRRRCCGTGAAGAACRYLALQAFHIGAGDAVDAQLPEQRTMWFLIRPRSDLSVVGFLCTAPSAK
jgi:hypothetical protein